MELRSTSTNTISTKYENEILYNTKFRKIAKNIQLQSLNPPVGVENVDHADVNSRKVFKRQFTRVSR